MPAPKNTRHPSADVPLADDRLKPAKSIEEIMAEQGITGPQDLDAMIGAGADWWTDEEFEEFQRWLRETRREGH